MVILFCNRPSISMGTAMCSHTQTLTTSHTAEIQKSPYRTESPLNNIHVNQLSQLRDIDVKL